MTQKTSPFIRNVHAVAAILTHSGGGYFVPYATVATNAEAEILAGTFGRNDLTPDDNIEGVIMSIASCLIHAGILECNSFDRESGVLAYRNDTEVRISKSMAECLDLEPVANG